MIDNVLKTNCKFCMKEFTYSVTQNKNQKRIYCSSKCQRSGRSEKIKFWAYATNEQKLQRLEISFNKKVIKQDGCWDWSGATKTGYGAIRANKKSIGAHRVSYMLKHGSIPDGYWVLHSCDNKICTNPDHLFIGTRQENIDDMVRKKRHKFWPGETNPRAKITNSTAKIIKLLLNEKQSATAIAKQFNINRAIVYGIKYGKNWNLLNR